LLQVVALSLGPSRNLLQIFAEGPRLSVSFHHDMGCSAKDETYPEGSFGLYAELTEFGESGAKSIRLKIKR
jgi:hypothetical protein